MLLQGASPALGMSLRKVSHKAFVFFCILEKSGKNEATYLAVSQLRGSTIAIITTHVPGPHMWASAGQGPSSSSQKQCKSDGRVQIYANFTDGRVQINNTVSVRLPLTKSKKKKL